jgi:hypothetical protein
MDEAQKKRFGISNKYWMRKKITQAEPFYPWF